MDFWYCHFKSISFTSVNVVFYETQPYFWLNPQKVINITKWVNTFSKIDSKICSPLSITLPEFYEKAHGLMNIQHLWFKNTCCRYLIGLSPYHLLSDWWTHDLAQNSYYDKSSGWEMDQTVCYLKAWESNRWKIMSYILKWMKLQLFIMNREGKGKGPSILRL